MDKGYVYLSRKVKDNWVWDAKPFSYGQAWIDLILLANHTDKDIVFNGEVRKVKRGQHVTSILKLSEAWGWSRKKTRSFLGHLERDGMVTTRVTTHGITVTIVKYDNYQVKGTAKGTAKSTTKVQPKNSRGTQTSNEKEMNKELKEETPPEDSFGWDEEGDIIE